MTRSLSGRRFLLPGVDSSFYRVRAEAERQSHALPIQATAQDLMAGAMARVEVRVLPELEAMGVDVLPLLQIHDELMFEHPDEETVPGAYTVLETLVVDALTRPNPLSVPLEASGVTGRTWGELEK